MTSGKNVFCQRISNCAFLSSFLVTAAAAVFCCAHARIAWPVVHRSNLDEKYTWVKMMTLPVLAATTATTTLRFSPLLVSIRRDSAHNLITLLPS